MNGSSEKCIYVMLYTIWNHLHIFKNVRNTHGGVLLLVKLQTSDFRLLLEQ